MPLAIYTSFRLLHFTHEGSHEGGLLVSYEGLATLQWHPRSLSDATRLASGFLLFFRVSSGCLRFVDEVLILSLDRVRIGSNVCISQRAFLCTGSHDFRKETFDLITGPITIGDGSWIAACAFVGPGAEVPAGTMVKAGETWKRRD